MGIAASTVAFTTVFNVFHGRLPLAHADRIVRIHDFERSGGWGVLVDHREYERRRDRLTGIAELAEYHERSVLVTRDGRAPEIRRAAHISPNLWRAVGVAPHIRRDFTTADPVAAGVALISDRLHERLFGRDAAALGLSRLCHTIRIDGPSLRDPQG